ncbi:MULTISPECIES: hypothetical protein [Pseudoalteromonas]|uniref:hypothetical protein n=1 Tax=Pseudoalteromonas TaxID=53246 RepID=UPI0012FD7098|nr:MULTISPECIES: hypothetical protein [Pseudoalteromonas]
MQKENSCNKPAEISYANLVIKKSRTPEENQLLKSTAQQLFDLGMINKENKLNAICKM